MAPQRAEVFVSLRERERKEQPNKFSFRLPLDAFQGSNPFDTPDELRPIAHDLNDPTSNDRILDGLQERSCGRVERRIDLDGDELGSLSGL